MTFLAGTGAILYPLFLFPDVRYTHVTTKERNAKPETQSGDAKS